MKPGVWIALLLSLAASPAPGQSASLDKTANQARDAWFGHEVSRLARTRYGPVELPSDLPMGRWRLIPIEILASVGLKPAAPPI